MIKNKNDELIKESTPTVVAEGLIKKIAEEKRSAAPRLRIASSYSPNVFMDLRLYDGSKSAHKYRARLLWEGRSTPYVETYCDSKKEAEGWAREEGQEALIQKMKPRDLRKLQVGRGMLFQLAVKLISSMAGKEFEEAAEIKAYFGEHDLLVQELSRKPVERMTAEDFGEAIGKALEQEARASGREKPKEKDVRLAVRMVNAVLNLCHSYRLLHKRIRVEYNNRSTDKHIRGMRNALGHFVIPDETCKELYRDFKSKLKKNAYYLGALLALTMALALKEICALKYCDICGLFEEWRDGDEWVVPKSPIWLLKIRRFYRKTEEDGKEVDVLTDVAPHLYKYRVLVIPSHMKVLLEKYILDRGKAVNGNMFLIPAHKGFGGVTPNALKKFLQKVMEESGLTDMFFREIFLPAKDAVHEDEWRTLAPTVSIFQNSLYYKFEKICEFEKHEIRAFFGLPPYTTIDRHYWESKDPFALLRMYGKMYSWDLRGVDWDEVTTPGHSRQEGQELHEKLVPPISYTVDAFAQITGEAGESLLLALKAYYGFHCRYTVEHSEEKRKKNN